MPKSIGIKDWICYTATIDEFRMRRTNESFAVTAAPHSADHL
jgi:hypothetical protein